MYTSEDVLLEWKSECEREHNCKFKTLDDYINAVSADIDVRKHAELTAIQRNRQLRAQYKHNAHD